MPKAGELGGLPPNILLVGPTGSAKTSFTLSAGPALRIIDCDGNIRSGLHCKDGHDEARAEADVVLAHETDPQRKAEGFRKVKIAVEKIVKEARKPPEERGFDVVAIDSLSTLWQGATLHVQGAAGKIGEQLSLPDRGTANREVLQVIYALKAAPVAFIAIAHDTVIEVGGENQIRLGLPGKQLNQEIPKIFSDIWYAHPKPKAGGRTEFQIYTAPAGAIRARSSADLPNPLDASEGLPSVFERMGYPIRTIEKKPQAA